ncbi:type II toxin-antitoxin system RelE/ParE family toxin [Halomonas mongoliensis]|uniref:Type II toxin-antitoxin system RelE/ParE family toxin n=1 Tax=Halomonas mongoliensis TaxID=321265 RepID=A0ABU1GNL7_9GAMM|nr:type II toxin-antitoxin system RelE/ParE family toxin [Halomonas mongoliensis]MDR5893038.1 type II toxin-antitoxin system RelE/ParE family toxin [Halomonas mongoliensis]
MALQVELTASAFEDLRELYDFIAEDSPPAAERLLAAIEARIMSLGQHPERGSHPRELLELGIRDYRQVIEPPVRILYRQHRERLIVYLIAHSRRDMQRLLARRLLS